MRRRNPWGSTGPGASAAPRLDGSPGLEIEYSAGAARWSSGLVIGAAYLGGQAARTDGLRIQAQRLDGATSAGFTEEALVGTLGDPWPDIDQEETSRFRIVGFTTDPSRRVDVFLLDNDGSERRLTTLQPQAAGQIGRGRNGTVGFELADVGVDALESEGAVRRQRRLDHTGSFRH